MGSPDVSRSTHPTNKRKRPHDERENTPVASSPKAPPECISRPSKRARRTSEGQRAPPSPQNLPSPSAQPKDGEEAITPQKKLEKLLWEMDKLSYLRLSYLGRPDVKHHANEWYHSLLAPPQIALVNPRDATSALDHGVHDVSPGDEDDDDDDATNVGDPEEDETTREARMREEKTKDAIPLEQVVLPCQHWVDEIGPRAGCPILNSKVLMTLRRGSASLITLRSGRLGWEQFKYLNKSWPLARPDLLKNLFAEAALYQSEQHLGNSNLAPKFYGVFIDSTSVSLATALPSPRFWINAHPGMPRELKRLVFDALDALHERGILLGRVVLRNILITAANEVRFTEFSSARVVVQPAGAVVPLPFATREDFRHEKQVMRSLLREGRPASAPPQRVVVPGQKIFHARCALNWFLGGLKAELRTTKHGAKSYGNIKRLVPDELEADGQGHGVIQKRIAGLFASKQHEAAAAREQMFDDMDNRVNEAPETHPTRRRVRFTDPETTLPPRMRRSPPPHGLVIPAKGVLRNVGERLYVNKSKLAAMDQASERLDEDTLRGQWFDTTELTRQELFFVMRVKTRELTGISSRHVQPPILF